LKRALSLVVLSGTLLTGCDEPLGTSYEVEFSAPEYLTQHAKYLEEEL
jgi:hypothetical protein